MKGILFTEFLEYVNEKYGLETEQTIIDLCDLSTQGAYTSVGTYSHHELNQLLEKLAELKSSSRNEILEDYGLFFFKSLLHAYPEYFNHSLLFGFLKTVNQHIHPNVQKLYPDAKFPVFETLDINHSNMQMDYYSERRMVHFAIGMIKGASIYFNETIEISPIRLNPKNQNHAQFTIKISE